MSRLQHFSIAYTDVWGFHISFFPLQNGQKNKYPSICPRILLICFNESCRVCSFKIMDKTLQSDSGESEELFDLAMDSFNLLAFSHRDLSSQRRRLLAPAIANKYKQLCSETAPISPLYLFGEEESLEKKVKEIDDRRKLGSKINLNVQPSTSQQRYKTGASFNRTGGYRQYKPQFKSSHSSYKRQFKQHFLPKRAQNQQTTKNQYKKAELGHQRK